MEYYCDMVIIHIIPSVNYVVISTANFTLRLHGNSQSDHSQTLYDSVSANIKVHR